VGKFENYCFLEAEKREAELSYMNVCVIKLSKKHVLET